MKQISCVLTGETGAPGLNCGWGESYSMLTDRHESILCCKFKYRFRVTKDENF
jgi:hypothetical protein